MRGCQKPLAMRCPQMGRTQRSVAALELPRSGSAGRQSYFRTAGERDELARAAKMAKPPCGCGGWRRRRRNTERKE